MIWTLYLALQTLVMVVLAVFVIAHRRKNRISFGVGNDPTMERKVRIFGNHNEYTPMHLILLAAIEGSGGPILLIHCLGGSFLLGRLFHILALSTKKGYGNSRAIGMILTLTVLIISAVILLVRVI